LSEVERESAIWSRHVHVSYRR